MPRNIIYQFPLQGKVRPMSPTKVYYNQVKVHPESHSNKEVAEVQQPRTLPESEPENPQKTESKPSMELIFKKHSFQNDIFTKNNAQLQNQ